MRLIDADALVAQWEVDAEQAEDFTAKMFIYGAIRDVKHAPTIETDPHWIPCSEKMPEEHEWIGTKKFGTTISDEVYVTFENEEGERFCRHMKFQNGELGRYDQVYMDAWFKGSKPIAWMEMPTPYREDGTEGG